MSSRALSCVMLPRPRTGAPHDASACVYVLDAIVIGAWMLVWSGQQTLPRLTSATTAGQALSSRRRRPPSVFPEAPFKGLDGHDTHDML
jgi:hypothetical protein